jgi:hypothetical protein
VTPPKKQAAPPKKPAADKTNRVRTPQPLTERQKWIAKMVGTVIFSAVALALVSYVLLHPKDYSADDKRSAWSVLTGVGGFWIGLFVG